MSTYNRLSGDWANDCVAVADSSITDVFALRTANPTRNPKAVGIKIHVPPGTLPDDVYVQVYVKEQSNVDADETWIAVAAIADGGTYEDGVGSRIKVGVKSSNGTSYNVTALDILQ